MIDFIIDILICLKGTVLAPENIIVLLILVITVATEVIEIVYDYFWRDS